MGARVNLFDDGDRTVEVAMVFASGASESDTGDLRGLRVEAIRMPAAWTAAAVAFSESPALAGTYQPLDDDGGGDAPAEARLQLAGGRTNRVGPFLDPFRFLRLRSVNAGTGGAVAQTAARTVVLVCRLAAEG